MYLRFEPTPKGSKTSCRVVRISGVAVAVINRVGFDALPGRRLSQNERAGIRAFIKSVSQ
jgi:hypothetical protein